MPEPHQILSELKSLKLSLLQNDVWLYEQNKRDEMKTSFREIDKQISLHKQGVWANQPKYLPTLVSAAEYAESNCPSVTRDNIGAAYLVAFVDENKEEAFQVRGLREVDNMGR